MRRTKKSEYKRGVFDGMWKSFLRMTDLPDDAKPEARQIIAIRASCLAQKTWRGSRAALKDLGDEFDTLAGAHMRGFTVGIYAWEGVYYERAEVERMAKLHAQINK
jgi:hypothetical protein